MTKSIPWQSEADAARFTKRLLSEGILYFVHSLFLWIESGEVTSIDLPQVHFFFN